MTDCQARSKIAPRRRAGDRATDQDQARVADMINDGPLRRFEPLANDLVKPIYADYTFGNIPNTIHYLLAGEHLGPLLPPDCFGGQYPHPNKVVLLFIDSFGWEFWQQYQTHFRTTRHVVEEGILTPISALFPSTTAASVATLNLGVRPAEHALYEWNIYIPAYGEVIQSLPFRPLGNHPNDACLAKGYDPRQMLAVHETVHQRLARRQVRSIQFAHRSYASSAFNKIAQAGAEVVRHSTLAEALVQLKEAVTQITDKAWLSLYWGSIDAIAHTHGPGTSFHAAEIASFWQTFDYVFRDINAADTLYLFTADHGHVYADPRRTIYLNERAPVLAECIPMSPTATPIYPSGSPRDIFMHVRPERFDETLTVLHDTFDDVAFIEPIEMALDQQLFGPQPIGPEFRRRLGDILILPYAGHFVWWHQPGILESRSFGNHGGLTREELISVIGVVDGL
jgi:Type I phosphodiesterase / nucleotide pyrophosphatase